MSIKNSFGFLSYFISMSDPLGVIAELHCKDLSKEVVDATVKRIVVGVESVFTVEYKLDFGE